MKIMKSRIRRILEESERLEVYEAAPAKIKISKSQLKSIIKEEASRLLREEEEEKISAGDFVKAMKEDLPTMMKLVPDAMNDDLMNAIRALVAASKYDASAFKAAIAIVMTKTENAQEKIKEQA